MTVVGITMVRDEADIIGTTIRHMMTQVDGLIVANNRSVDGTNDILYDLQLENPDYPLTVMFDDEVGYMQSEKMTRMAHAAGRDLGATWIVPFDADEIWYSQWGRLGSFLESLGDDLVKANLFDHVCTGLDDLDEPDPVRRIRWRRDYCAPLPKVACRYSPDLVIGMGNHEAWHAEDGPMKVSGYRVAIRHFPYRSVDQLCRKIANGAEAYAATDLPVNYGAHWRQWGQILDQSGPDAIAELFHKWYWREEPGLRITIEGEPAGPLKFDPAIAVTTIG